MPKNKNRGRKKHKPQAVRLVLDPEQKEGVASLVKDYPHVSPDEVLSRISDPAVAGAFIARLPLNADFPIELVFAIKNRFSEKKLDKEVKRAIFKLKNMGLFGDDILAEKKSAPIITPVKKENPAAFLGPIDDSGFRAVFLELHRSAVGVDLGAGMASDKLGIQQFLFGNFSKKVSREIKEGLSELTGPLIETSLSHATTILEEAYLQRQENSADENLRYYMEIRPWLLEESSILEQPVIYDFIDRDDYLSDSNLDVLLENLFDNEYMSAWHIDNKDIQPFISEIEALEESILTLSDIQKTERRIQIMNQGMDQLFPDQERQRLKKRFEEMAYFFYKLGNEEMAGVALTAAVGMEEKDTVLKRNRVVEFFLERSLNFYMLDEDSGDDDEIDAPGSLIIT
jgi:hypothetical protein